MTTRERLAVREWTGTGAFHDVSRLPFLPEHILPLCASAGWREEFQRAGDKFTGDAIAVCRKVCSMCEFQPECEAYALRTRQSWGVWGGRVMTPGMRHRD